MRIYLRNLRLLKELKESFIEGVTQQTGKSMKRC